MPRAVLATPWPAFLPEQVLLQISGEERREAGRLHFSEALLFLLRHVSHPQLSELADWACHESGNLHTSQISHMRNNKVRMLGTKAIDALGRINQAGWVARHRPELLPSLGCGTLTPRIRTILEAYRPLIHPLSQEPLGAGELMAIYLGYLRLPIEIPRSLSTEEAEVLAERLGDWLDRAFQAQGLGLREASRRLQQAWSGEAAGGKRLVRVLAGLEDYGARQLAEEWERIATAAQTVLGQPADPWRLADELLAADKAGPQEPAVATSAARPARPSTKRAAAHQPGDGKPAGGRSGKGKPVAEKAEAIKPPAHKQPAGKATARKGPARKAPAQA
jgi:hypothetical protein